MDNSKIADFYDTYVSYQQQNSFNLRHKKVLDELKNHITNAKGSVLEGGCGAGFMSFLLNKHFNFSSHYAIDLSPKSIEYAKQFNKDNHNIQFLAYDLAAIQLNKTFDYVLLLDVVEHFPKNRLPELFKTLAQHMHNDSLLLINIPFAPVHATMLKDSPADAQIIDLPVPARELIDVLDDCGLGVLSLKTYNVWAKNEYQFFSIYKNTPDIAMCEYVYKPSFTEKLNYKLKKMFGKL